MTKVTHKETASNAAKVLGSKDAGSEAKSAAGSTLAQAKHPEKFTSKEAATKASHVLHSSKSSPEEKSAAGSALAQREK